MANQPGYYPQYRHAIITGGSSGIGKAIAKLLMQGGTNLTLVARNQQKLEAVQTQLQALQIDSNQQVIIQAVDLARRDQAEQAISTAISHLGPPDLLITSAGIARPGYFQEIPLNIFEQTMAVNYFGTLYCLKAALPSLQQQGGHMVLISSGAGLIGLFGYTPYSPSKFAVRGLAESLRGELKALGVGLSIVYPPDTDTPQLAYEKQFKPPETQRMTATAPCLSAEQVARIILKGVGQRQFMITPGFEMTLLSRLHSIISPLLQWQFDRIVWQQAAHNSIND
jgi:3-dehydrosphinganine reductase